MAGVPFHPFPAYFVPRNRILELFPEISVQNVSGPRPSSTLFAPAMRLPFRQPLRNPVFHVLRIRDNGDLAGFTKRLQPLNDGEQLHSIVRSAPFGAEQLLVMTAEAKNTGPTTGTGVANACAVSRQRNLFHFPYAKVYIIRSTEVVHGRWKNSEAC